MYLVFKKNWPKLRFWRVFTFLYLIWAWSCAPASAQQTQATVQLDGAEVRLLSAPTMAGALLGDALPLRPDERLAFLSIALEDGWKTYWRLPGRFGFAPLLDWSQSENVESIETIFPSPSLFDEGDGTSIGYSGHVLWPVRIQPIDPKEPVLISLSVELGLCQELCVPVSADLISRLSPSAEQMAPLSAVLALAGALPAQIVDMPSGAFDQTENGLSLALPQIFGTAGFAVAENDAGKHALLQADGQGTLSGPWRHQTAPTRLTVIAPETGMLVYRLDN